MFFRIVVQNGSVPLIPLAETRYVNDLTLTQSPRNSRTYTIVELEATMIFNRIQVIRYFARFFTSKKHAIIFIRKKMKKDENLWVKLKRGR